MKNKSTQTNHICGDSNSPCDCDCIKRSYREKTTQQMSYVYKKSPIAHRILSGGGNIYDCLYWLVKHQEDLVKKLILAESIAPRKIKLKDGKVAIWRCPEELIPEASITDIDFEVTCPTCEGSGDNGVLGDPCECNTCMGNGKVMISELDK